MAHACMSQCAMCVIYSALLCAHSNISRLRVRRGRRRCYGRYDAGYDHTLAHSPPSHHALAPCPLTMPHPSTSHLITASSSLPRITASHHCHASLPTNSHLTPPPPHSALSAHTLTYLVCVLGEGGGNAMGDTMHGTMHGMHGIHYAWWYHLAHPRTSFHTLAPLTYL